MKELVNLVVNVLGSMGNNENIKISRKNDYEFSFEGDSNEDGMPYTYEISVKFKPIEKSQSEIAKELEINMAKNLKEAIKKELEEERKKELEKKKEPELLNEDKKEENKDGND